MRTRPTPKQPRLFITHDPHDLSEYIMYALAEIHEPSAIRHATLVGLLRSRALWQPQRTAYTFLHAGEPGAESLTYGELDRQARAVASVLQSLGAAGRPALLLYPPGLEFIRAFFGCLYAGAVAVPAYPPRLNRALPRLRSIVVDSGATLALATASVIEKVKPMLAHAPDLSGLRWLDTEGVLSAPADGWRDSRPDADRLAFLQYTSGSTGTPKGVMLSHGNLLHNASLVHAAMEHTPEDKYVSWLPTFHDMGFMAGVLQPLYAGCPVVLMSPVAFLQSPVSWLRAISEHSGTTSGGPNFAYELCVRKVTEEQRATLDLSSWSGAFNGAEPIRAETLDRFAEAFGPCGFRREAFYPCYGLAESTLIVSGGKKQAAPVVRSVSAGDLERHRAVESREGDGRGRRLVGCGRALRGQEISVVRPDTLAACAEGEVGEIWVSGQSVAAGYWGRPDETERTFRARIKGTGEGPFLRTGDLGFEWGGELYVTGRLKDLIILRGVNHYPQDIELTAERAHPSLRSGAGAAFTVEVENEERLVVVHEVEPRLKAGLDAVLASIRRAVSEEHELQVYAIALVRSGSIPKTSSGKLQRYACREAFLAGGLDVRAQWCAEAAPEDVADSNASAADFSHVEGITAWLAAELARRLNLRAAELDAEEPVTSYGIDSLLAVELTHAVEKTFGVELPMTSLLQGAGLRQLACEVFERRTALPEVVVEGPPQDGAAAGAYTLSHGQRALWLTHQLAPSGTAYTIAHAVRISAPVDTDALRRAFRALVERHAALRTNFMNERGEPYQHVHEHGELCFEVTDARGWGEEELGEHLTAESSRPFDLRDDPLLRVNVYERPGGAIVLLLTLHHIVADFWSLSVLLGELGALYEAEREGRAARLEPLAAQYADYVRWQTRMLAGAEGARLRRFWHQRLAGKLPQLNLPTDRPRPIIQTYRGASVSFSLGAEVTAGLKALGGAHRATLFTTLLAAFQTLLHRYTEQTDLLVGTATAGRPRAEFAPLVGYFVNPVVLRAELAGDPGFVDYLEWTRGAVLAAFEHQEYPFHLLVEELQPERDASRSPVFNVMFVLQKNHREGGEGLAPLALGEAGARVQSGPLELESVALEQHVTLFDLSLIAAESDGAVVASLQYNSDLYDASTAERMAAHFRTLVTGLVAEPSRRLSTLPLLSAAEWQQVIGAWNDTPAAEWAARSLQEVFEAQARRTPELTAVVCPDGELSYGELNLRANQLARYLKRQGAAPESLVGIAMSRCVELIVALLGVLKAGCAYIPLDTEYPQERLAQMITDAAVPLLLTQSALADKLPQHEARVLCLDLCWPEIADEDTADLPHETWPDSLAYAIYTSGSTGRPKGVGCCHRGGLNLLYDMERRQPLNPGDRCSAWTSLSFDVCFYEIFSALLFGGTLYPVPEEVRPSARLYCEWLAQNGIASGYVPPFMLRDLAEAVAERPGEMRLRRLLVGVEPIPEQLLAEIAGHVPGLHVINGYGPTEASVCATFFSLDPSRARARRTPVGRPVQRTRVYLLDRHLQPVPSGAPGELYIGGEGLARGYVRQPALTSERFIPDPFAAGRGARMYRTGDHARHLPGGDIEFLSRTDQQVKIRGFRVEPKEIETMLAEHAGVRSAVVRAQEQPGGEKQLVAYFVPQHDAPELSGELRRHLRRKLPEYMIPSAFVELDALPQLSSGKVNHAALPLLGAQAHARGAGEPAPHATATEQIIAGVWQEVLRLERVDMNTNFFDLGGHSLSLVRVHGRLSELLKRELHLPSLFAYPTISALAEHLSGDTCAQSEYGQVQTRARRQAEALLRRQSQRQRRTVL